MRLKDLLEKCNLLFFGMGQLGVLLGVRISIQAYRFKGRIG